MLTSVKYWLWLTSLLPPTAAWQVYCHFGSPEHAYFADPGEYEQIDALSPEQRRLLSDKSTDQTERLLERCDRGDIRILTFNDTDYPERLRNIETPPLVLYLRGKLLRLDERAVIAFAGTRRATPYGTGIARDFARDITRGGGIVATGIVAGCDESAATGALRAGGPVLGVLAGGVDVPYYDSASSRDLLADMAAVGMLLSESPPGTPHRGSLFHRRNAILCGVSVGLLCVEAGLRSGTLGVASIAAEQGRDIFAVPANLGAPMSAGTNDLLRQGLALPVLSGADILSHYPYYLPRREEQPDFTRWQVVRVPAQPRAQEKAVSPEPPEAAAPTPPEPISDEKRVDTAPNSGYIDLSDPSAQWTETERTLLQALAGGPATMEALIDQTGLPSSQTSATLTLLAVKGVVEECSGGRFRLHGQG
ncbi:MAG: DNA-protecting protein DprA [Clostridiales bacterium]|nr:DNA-protecting protein DprA [Clostridiales bacterium]